MACQLIIKSGRHNAAEDLPECKVQIRVKMQPLYAKILVSPTDMVMNGAL